MALHAFKEFNNLSATASALRVGLLKNRDLSGIFRGKTRILFILGSGSSVNLLGPAFFDHMAEHGTIGINGWMVHPFIPDVYMHEPVGDAPSDFPQLLPALSRKKFATHVPTILTLRPNSLSERNELLTVPAYIRASVRMYYRYSPPGIGVGTLRTDTRWLLKVSRAFAGSLVLDTGASIVRAAHIGLNAGFKKIVFVGVDLRNTAYFWENKSAWLDDLGIASLRSGQRSDVHDTMLKTSRRFTVVEALTQIVASQSTVNGAEFFVTNPDSPLAEFMEIYKVE